MLAKEVFLKKIKIKMKNILVVFVLIFFSNSVCGKEEINLKKINLYLNSITEFYSTFLQIENNTISEGKFYLKNNRIRIEYSSPHNIVFVLKKNKVMFFNKDLQEVQYFNPKDTLGQFFLDLFNKDKFLFKTNITHKVGYLFLTKEIYLDEQLHTIKIYFEKNPIVLRKIEINNKLSEISFTLLNPSFNPDLQDKIFSLANPTLN